MTLSKRFRIGIFAVCVSVFYPQISDADGFKSSDVLKWQESSQDSFFQTSIGMAGVIASQNRREAARCIDQWYFADKTKLGSRNQHIRDIMSQYPNHDPQAIILAVVQKACGKLTNTD